MKKLFITAFALASGITAAVASAICALFVAIAPEGTKTFFSFLFHLDLSSLPYKLTWATFIGSLVCWFVTISVIFGIGAWFYNRLAAKSKDA